MQGSRSLQSTADPGTRPAESFGVEIDSDSGACDPARDQYRGNLWAGSLCVSETRGRDRGTDIAVLKLDQEIEMQPAQFGNTQSLSVGELRCRCPNAAGQHRRQRWNHRWAHGRMAGCEDTYRSIHSSRPELVSRFLRGCAGGRCWRRVGLNTSGLLRGKPITIPSSTLSRIAEEIAASGHVARPYIGLVMQPVQIPESLQKKAGVNAGVGLLVMHVEAGGPADLGGVFLVTFSGYGGQSFSDLDDVYEALGRKGVGQDVQTSLIRGGQQLPFTIRIGERPPR